MVVGLFCWTCFTFTESFRANYVTSGGHVSLLKDILLFAKRHFETRQKADWKAPRRWKEFGISSQRIEEEAALTWAGLRCQDASTGCKYWHVMQPWATSAKRWRKREKSTQRILICMWMSVNKNVWHIAKDSSWRWQVGGGGVGRKNLYSPQQSGVCVEEKERAGVCARVLHLSIGEPPRSERNSENERKVYGKVDEMFCVGEWKGISRLEDLDMNIIIIRFTVRLMWQKTAAANQDVFLFFIRLFFVSESKTNPVHFFLSSLFSHAAFNRVGFSVAWTHRLIHTRELGCPEWQPT